jgi:hypothetical protein
MFAARPGVALHHGEMLGDGGRFHNKGGWENGYEEPAI